MGFADRFKELTDDISKSVEDSGIKEKTKSAARLIADVVESSKRGIEAKYEENKQRIEEQKRLLAQAQEEVVILVKDNFNSQEEENPCILNEFNKILSFTNEYYEKVIAFKTNCYQGKISYGEYIQEKNIKKVLDQWKKKEVDEVNEVEEKAVFSYYNSSKDYFLLTNLGFYFKMKHPREDFVYEAKIESDYINKIQIITDEKPALALNGVMLFNIDCKEVSYLEEYLTFINSGQPSITEEYISLEIEKYLGEELANNIKAAFEENEYFKFVSRKDSVKAMGALTICTNKQLIASNSILLSNGCAIESVYLADIVYTELSDKNIDENTNLLFRENTLEVIVPGKKLIVRGLKGIECREVLNIIKDGNGIVC